MCELLAWSDLRACLNCASHLALWNLTQFQTSRKHNCMTTILSVRIDPGLAERAKKASGGNLSAFVRAAIEDKVEAVELANGNPMIVHIKARAGTWDGYISGEELLRKTRL